MGIERVAHRVDRWLRRPRFRTPGSGIVLAVLLVAVLLLRAYGSGASKARPPYPPPPSRPELPRIELPRIEPPSMTAPPVQIPAEPGCPKGCAAPPPGCDVKGNISFKSGERIYHLPGQSFYDQTKISPGRGEAWFCTEAEARANGWRKSKR